MRFILLVTASADSEGQSVSVSVGLREEMSRFHRELARAGALLDGAALSGSSEGWRLQFGEMAPGDGEAPPVVSQGSLVGYTVIEVATREEAQEWTRRFPHPPGLAGGIEVRQLFDVGDLPPRSAPNGSAPSPAGASGEPVPPTGGDQPPGSTRTPSSI